MGKTIEMQVSGPVSSKGLVLALMTSRCKSDPRWWPHDFRSKMAAPRRKIQDGGPTKSDTRGEFNNASAFKRSLYWCQALHITNKDRYQSTSARRALALLNTPQMAVPVTRSVTPRRVSQRPRPREGSVTS